MNRDIVWLPAPRRVEWLEGEFMPAEQRYLWLDGPPSDSLRETGRRLRNALGAQGATWSLTHAAGSDGALLGARIHVRRELFANEQAYRLRIEPTGIVIQAAGSAAARYAVLTLAQLAAQQPAGALPCVQIEDWPDFPNRGVMLDISRDKVPTFATLRDMIRLLAGFKLNQFQLYTEHTFAYRNWNEVWAEASPLTGEEILELDALCRAEHIELVPNQNSFGHMERWLKTPRLNALAETPAAVLEHYKLNPFDKSFSLCPLDPGSLQLIEELYAELLPHFSSGMFNVGCDETFELGQGRSQAECEARGKGRVYLDFLLKIHGLVQRHGRTMQFWGDIIMKHPELIAELPRDLIALEWGYEANHPFAEDTQKFAAAGVPFYVCPGTSAWNSFGGRTANALANLESAARHGAAQGALGFLNTEWGDNGYWQYLPTSYLGYAAGAGLSWCRDANAEADWARVLDALVLQDSAGVLGQVLYDLGNVYLAMPSARHCNSTLIWRALVEPLAPLAPETVEQLKPAELDAALARIDAVLAALPRARSARADAELIAREIRNTAAFMRHSLHLWQARLKLGAGHHTRELDAAMRGQLADELRPIIEEHKVLWRARNREGGLAESAGRLEVFMQFYNA